MPCLTRSVEIIGSLGVLHQPLRGSVGRRERLRCRFSRSLELMGGHGCAHRLDLTQRAGTRRPGRPAAVVTSFGIGRCVIVRRAPIRIKQGRPTARVSVFGFSRRRNMVLLRGRDSRRQLHRFRQFIDKCHTLNFLLHLHVHRTRLARRRRRLRRNSLWR